MGAKKCRCGSAATHNYGGSAVCSDCYKTQAAVDDSPHKIPADYDWSAEMDGRRLD